MKRCIKCYFLLVVLFFSYAVGAEEAAIQATIVNRSMRVVEYKVYGQFSLCLKGKLQPKQKKTIPLGSAEGSKCQSKEYYRFDMAAFQKTALRHLTGECVLLPQKRNADFVILWDGVKCWVRDAE